MLGLLDRMGGRRGWLGMLMSLWNDRFGDWYVIDQGVSGRMLENVLFYERIASLIYFLIVTGTSP